MNVNRERVALLVAALRSGEYQRGPGRLHKITPAGDTWCCLGVASDVAVAHGLDVTRDISPDYFGGDREVFGGYSDEYLCNPVRDWYGFTSRDPQLRDAEGNTVPASSWNDGGDPVTHIVRGDFTDIADAFERTYLNTPAGE